MWIVSRMAGLYRHLMEATKELFIRILMGILIFLGYVLLSLFIYAVMRRIMVPQKLHSLPVHLQYNSQCLSQSSPEELSRCPFPYADFLLNDGKKLLRSGQHYRIVLEMEVPEKELNLEAGTFMVNITFYTTKYHFLDTSARPVTVRYKSFLLRTMSTLFFAVPLLFGVWEQKQTVELVLFEDYYEQYGDGALSAKVTLETNRVHVYSTSLIIDANFSGFTFYLYQWPVSMTVIVVISILITLCTCTVLMWVKDVLNDFEERRAAGRQHRQEMIQRRGGTGGRARGEHRTVTQRRNQHRIAETVGVASTERGGGNVSETPTEETVTTLDSSGGQRADSQSSGTVTPTDTRESSEMRDTESEVSSGLSDVIGNLQSLRREIEQDSATDTSSTEGGGANVGSHTQQGVGRTSEMGEIRRRTGNL